MAEGSPIEIDIEQNDSTYLQVRFKKKEGSLTLTASTISFQTTTTAEGTNNCSNNNIITTIHWKDVRKHQVSPPSHHKSLLKLVLKSGVFSSFQLCNSEDLECIRKDISERLKCTRSSSCASVSTAISPSSTSSAAAAAAAAAPPTATTSKKRRFSELQSKDSRNPAGSASFGDFDVSTAPETMRTAARLSLLERNPALKQQHSFLVVQTTNGETYPAVSEEDFWTTHESLLEEECARTLSCKNASQKKAETLSNLLLSNNNLSSTTSSSSSSSSRKSKVITLGVEEIRQIFILYPAVHAAYEELVPVQLSEEEFWRKYLESEYIHRGRSDRQQQQQPQSSNQPKQSASDDLFSRYDQKLQDQKKDERSEEGEDGTALAGAGARRHTLGRNLAVGQFDLASTYETERGNLLQGPKDNHPPNSNQADVGGDDIGSNKARVIQKYNRHWAMVLHPKDALQAAGGANNLMQVAHKSVRDALPNDVDALAGGGLDLEMKKLVELANSTAQGNDDDDDDENENDENHRYEPLTLQNVESYFVSKQKNSTSVLEADGADAAKRHASFGKTMTLKMNALVQSLNTDDDNDDNTTKRSPHRSFFAFPSPCLGSELMTTLTDKMAKDSVTAESASMEMANKLPQDFRKKLQLYFRRSSELLRHFFGLRKLDDQAVAPARGGNNSKNNNSSSSGHQHYGQKLARIVSGLETVYREMEGMQKDSSQTDNELGEMMQMMVRPIMDQLDLAFRLHQERTSGDSGRAAASGVVEVIDVEDEEET